MKTTFKPGNHIYGKVYDLTQENFTALLRAYEKLRSEHRTLQYQTSKFTDTVNSELLLDEQIGQAWSVLRDSLNELRETLEEA